MVGDSVVGCFLQAPGDGDESPGAVLKIGPLSEREARSPGTNLTGRLADPFLPARRAILPRAMSEERDIFG